VIGSRLRALWPAAMLTILIATFEATAPAGTRAT
jgi:hypothetical protein